MLAAAIGPEASVAGAVLPGLALAFGPLVGGVFAEQNWWHVFFWAGVPLAAVAGLGALPGAAHGTDRGAVADPAARPRRGPDRPHDRLGPERGVGLGLVGRVDARGRRPCSAARYPTCAPRRSPGRRSRAASPRSSSSFPEYFQLARELSGLRSGTLLLTVTFPAVVVWAASILLAGRIPALLRGAAGAACAAAGLAALATIGAHTRYAVVIGALGLAGTGLGLAAGAAASLPRPSWPGASHAAAFAGATLGLAIGGAAFQFAQSDKRAAGSSFEEALAAGVGWARPGPGAAARGRRAADLARPASFSARPAAVS